MFLEMLKVWEFWKFWKSRFGGECRACWTFWNSFRLRTCSGTFTNLKNLRLFGISRKYASYFCELGDGEFGQAYFGQHRSSAVNLWSNSAQIGTSNGQTQNQVLSNICSETSVGPTLAEVWTTFGRNSVPMATGQFSGTRGGQLSRCVRILGRSAHKP